MKVTVENVYSETTKTFQGEPEQVTNQLLEAYPFLARYNAASFQDVVSKLSQQQAFMVKVEQ